MKCSNLLKAVAIVLAAVALTVAAGGAAGMVVIAEAGLYSKTVPEIRAERMESAVQDAALSLVAEYIETNLSNMTENALAHSSFHHSNYSYYPHQFSQELGSDGWYYSLLAEDGKTVLETNGPVSTPASNWTEYTFQISMTYPRLIHYTEVGPDTAWDVTRPAGTETNAPAYAAAECMRWYNDETGTYFDYYFEELQSPVYSVSIFLPKAYYVDGTQGGWKILEILVTGKDLLLPCLLTGLAVFAVAMIYLIIAAGHGRDPEQLKAGGLNAIPLDLYTVAAGGSGVLLVALGAAIIDWLIWQEGETVNPDLLILALLPFLGTSFLIVGYLFALAAQFKTPGGYWWRRSLVGRFLLLLRKCVRWTLRWGIRLFSLMGVMWQWLLVAGVLCFAWFAVLIASHLTVGLWVLMLALTLGATAAVVLYSAYAFGVILQGARRMADGNLNRKISTKYLIGCFADCANRLNALADVAMVAAGNQLKSERMKTELITNVSHDIKTPLTSIINYVDLLQKPHTEAQGEEYLAVLSRQSDRMKKLIEDLMDMSKATTGNMAVEIAQMDAAEAVNQALGEFADKLAAVPLTPVVRCPESPVMICADGKLVWRTLSNLLQNAVKYALPGTRLYVDITRAERNVVISLKNVSREELNISADELMERFVRGDASRNTEGSGLGLNIAKSLMELQQGQLRLLVDGDLFKTSLIFPSAE